MDLQQVHREGYICPRTVLEITPCRRDGTLEPTARLYVRSHEDINIPVRLGPFDAPNVVVLDTAYLSNESITSQQVDFATGQSTISTYNFSILEDSDLQFTNWFRAQANCTLRGARVRVFAGDRRLPYARYSQLTTQIIRSVQQHQCEWRFAAAGVLRAGNTDVFDVGSVPTFGAAYRAGETPLALCDSVEWEDVDENGQPIGPLRVLADERFYRNDGDFFYLKIEHDNGCEILRADQVQNFDTGLLQAGDVVDGVICVLNTGSVPFVVENIIDASLLVPFDAPVTVQPGTSECIWLWRHGVSQEEAEQNLANGPVAIVTTRSADGVITVIDGPEFDNGLGGLPGVTSTTPGHNVEIRKLWQAPTADITCGGATRPRAQVSVLEYRIVERGVFGSTIAPVETRDNITTIFRDGTDVSEAIVLRGSVPELMYLAMTGLRYDTDTPWWVRDNGDGTVDTTPKYSAQIDPMWIDRSSFSRERVPQLWELELEFICPQPDVANDFWEAEIGRWASHYLREEPTGQLSLQPLAEAGDASTVVAGIDNDDIFSTTQLTIDWQVPTELVVAWDWDPCNGSYRAVHTITNENAVADNCGARDGQYCAFAGVRSDLTSPPVVRNHMREFLAYRAVPRAAGCADICIEAALNMRVGQNIRVISEDHTIANQDNPKLPAELIGGVTSIRYEFSGGFARVCFEAPLKESYLITDLEFNQQPCATPEQYCEGRQRLAEVVTIEEGGVVRDQRIPMGHYCHEGYLRFEGTNFLEPVLGERTFGLAVAGVVEFAGTIDGTGSGYPGYAAGQAVEPAGQAPGYGTNESGLGGTYNYVVSIPGGGDGGNQDVDDNGIGVGDPNGNPDFGATGTGETTSTGDPNGNPDVGEVGTARSGPLPAQRTVPFTFTLPDGILVDLGCVKNPEPTRVVGRYFSYGNPATPLEMLSWELGGNGGAAGQPQLFSGPGTVTPIPGGDGGDGGAGMYVLAHNAIVRDNAEIILNGSNGAPSPIGRADWMDVPRCGIPGTGGNAGRFALVLDGASTSFIADPSIWVKQFTGARGLPVSENYLPLPETCRICGTLPAGPRQETNAALYRNLFC